MASKLQVTLHSKFSEQTIETSAAKLEGEGTILISPEENERLSKEAGLAIGDWWNKATDQKGRQFVVFVGTSRHR